MAGPRPLVCPGRGVMWDEHGAAITEDADAEWGDDELGRAAWGDVVEVAEVAGERARVTAPVPGWMDLVVTRYFGNTARRVPIVARYTEKVHQEARRQAAARREADERRREQRRRRLQQERDELAEVDALPPAERAAERQRRFYRRFPDGAPYGPEDLPRWAEAPPAGPPSLRVVVRDRWKGDSVLRLSPRDVEPRHAPSQALNKKVALWQGSIVHLGVDAVVNAANEALAAGGGICGAIHDQAGPLLAEECNAVPAREGGRWGERCPTGGAAVTGAYRLPARAVIHAVGPTEEDPALLRSAYRSALDAARGRGLRSVALCCLSAGIFGYPLVAATHVALDATRAWLDDDGNADAVDVVVFCVFLDHERGVYEQLLPAYFPHPPAHADGSPPRSPRAAPGAATAEGSA